MNGNNPNLPKQLTASNENFKTCCFCYWYAEIDDKCGSCMFNPPIPSPFAHEEADLEYEPNSWLYPVVGEACHCHEFKSRHEKTPQKET